VLEELKELKELKGRHEAAANESMRKEGQYKKEVQDLHKENDDLAGANANINYLASKKKLGEDLKQQLVATDAQLKAAEQNNEKLKAQLKAAENDLSQKQEEHKKALEGLHKEKGELASTNAIYAFLAANKKIEDGLKEELKQAKQTNQQLDGNIFSFLTIQYRREEGSQK
jgi:signal transduction histidine kinase